MLDLRQYSQPVFGSFSMDYFISKTSFHAIKDLPLDMLYKLIWIELSKINIKVLEIYNMGMGQDGQR